MLQTVKGLGLQKGISNPLDFITIPTTPDNIPNDAMSGPAVEHMGAQGAIDSLSESPSITSTIAHTNATGDTRPSHNDGTSASSMGDEAKDEHDTLDSDTTLVIPITNPSAFPIQRIQEVQSQHYPSTSIATMLCHLTPDRTITQVTADIQDGSVNHLFIRDPRLISALGLAPPDFDTITLDTDKLKIDETFKIQILPGQRPHNVDEWIMGELVSARHAYLYWLDDRRMADPKHGPYAAEAKALARQLVRKWPDVYREIEAVWTLEQGSSGKHYRENRMRYLGEFPTYPEGAEKGRVVRSMFG